MMAAGRCRKPTPTLATQVFPPPERMHDGSEVHNGRCVYCDSNCFSVTAQQSGERHYRNLFEHEDARAELDATLNDTKENLAYIKNKLQTHGDLLLKRWSKKSKDKRGTTLATAAPNCFGTWPPTTFPESSIDEDSIAWYPQHSRESCWLFADWMRVKDFAEDRTKLFALLHLRTEHMPQAWTMHDTIYSERAFETSPRVNLPYNSSWVQMFGDDYGRLVDFDTRYLHTWAIMSYPRALTTFRAQLDISDMLRRILDAILSDSSPSGNSKWSSFVSSDLYKSNGESRWSPYTHPALVTPYGFDTKVLLDKATAKFNELADHMEYLQTDPEYMLHHVLVFKEGTRFKDPVPVSIKWSRIAADLLGNLTGKLIQWSRLVGACRRVHEVFEEHRHNIRPGTPLPLEVGHAIWAFGSYTDCAAKIQSHVFMDALRRMRALQDHFVIVNVHGKYSWKNLKPLDPSKDSDRMLASAINVQFLMEENPICGARQEVKFLIDKLDHIEYDAAIDEEISGVALLDEMRTANLWSQLGPSEFLGEGVNTFLEELLDGEPDLSALASSLIDKIPKLKLIDSSKLDAPFMQQLGPLLRKFYEAPWPKDHKSATWLDKVTESRKCLAAFWQAAREEWKLEEEKMHGSLCPDTRKLIESMSYDLMPGYHEEVRQEKELGKMEIQRMRATRTRAQTTPQVLQTTWGNSEVSKTGFLPKQAKHTKVKATGPITADWLNVSILGVDDKGESETCTDCTPSRPVPSSIPVNRDSLGVFRKMFASSTGATPGSVKWTHLVQALTDAGLVATQAPGSAVTFTCRGKGGVNFHKPHPDPVVDAFMLRYMGKRLRKWFSWEGEAFVLRVKEDERSIV